MGFCWFGILLQPSGFGILSMVDLGLQQCGPSRESLAGCDDLNLPYGMIGSQSHGSALSKGEACERTSYSFGDTLKFVRVFHVQRV